MKLKKVLVLFFLLLMPILVKADTCDSESITIESIELEEKSDEVEETAEATIENNKIVVNLDMSSVGDKAKYKITVKNDLEEDIKLDDFLNADSDFISYSLEFEEGNEKSLVMGKSTEIVYLTIEYKNEITHDYYENGKFTDNRIMSVDMSTSPKEIIEQTNKINPSTRTGRYIISIIAVTIISIILFIVLRKTKVTKYLILLFGGLLIIPLYAKAICTYNLQIEANINISQNIICKRATVLHTETCNQQSNSNACGKNEGYGNTVTYGNLGTPGELNTGDAFDCDVNGDGVYDPVKERFYYVSDYFDTTASTNGENVFDSNYATLMYYSNYDTKTTAKQVTAGTEYSTTAEEKEINPELTTTGACYGPIHLVKDLPTTTEWSNVQLKETNRQILQSNRDNQNITSCKTGDLGIFSYEGRAARIVTWPEIMEGCHLDYTNYGKTNSLLDYCEFTAERTSYGGNYSGYGLWTETKMSDTYQVWTTIAPILSTGLVPVGGWGGRPVIDVAKTNIQYR